MERIVKITLDNGEYFYRVEEKHDWLFGLIKGKWHTSTMIVDPLSLCKIPAEFKTLREAEEYCGIKHKEIRKIIKYIN